MGIGRNWTKQEYDYLEENWGKVSLPTLCKNLNRNENAIHIKVQKLGLGAFLECGEYITVNQFYKALGRNGGTGYMIKSWVENRGLPIKTKRVNECSFRIIYLEEFWKWAEQYRSFVDFSKMEVGSLGEEPDWVKQQRRFDELKRNKFKTSPWTKDDDAKLVFYLKQYKYSYLDLEKLLHRTSGAIQRRINDLKLKERPLKADNHNLWTDEQFAELAKMINQGYTYELMSEKIGKSSKAIRGRIYYMYLSENLDKVRSILNGGNWGDNRPERNITHLTLSLPEKTAVKADMTKMISLLKGQIKSHYNDNDFWQKDMCVFWSESWSADFGYGCLCRQTSCDICTEFKPIKVQYCVRCGIDFLSRAESKVCDRCKKARKAQHFKKIKKLCGTEQEV
jgi:hypothetical protein